MTIVLATTILERVRDSWRICWQQVQRCGKSKSKTDKWSEREELGLGRSLDSLAVGHKQASAQAWHLPNASIHVWRAL
jgi:hypothetical protein